MGFIFFALIILSGLVFGHLFLSYWIHQGLFPQTSFSLLWRIIPLFLSTLFIVSSMRMHQSIDLISIYLYRISVWELGIFYFLFLISFIAWLTHKSFPLISLKFLVIISLVLGLIFAGFATYQGLRIQIREIDTNLPNLPPQLKNQKIVFFSDSHLGVVRGQKLSQKIVKTIQSINPQMVLAGGDIFDGENYQLDQLISPFQELKMPLIAITGNHEHFGPSAEFIKALEKANFQVIDGKKIDLMGLQIAGWPSERLNAIYEFGHEKMQNWDIDPDRPSILLKHSPDHLSQFSKKFDLFLAGHSHHGQIFPGNILTRMIFGIYEYGPNFMDKMQIYTSCGIGTWALPMRFPLPSELIVLNLK